MTDDDTLWSAFLTFIEQASAVQIPAVLFEGFRDQMIAEGVPSERATQSIRAIISMAVTRRDWSAPMFDRIYACPKPGFSTQPNAFLVEASAGRRPGTALDIAMGQGRNALYLASRGWKVTGFDVSREGVAAARQAAAQRDLNVEVLVKAHDDFEYGSNAWDLIVMTYALVPVTDTSYASTLIESLRPGGLLVAESFATVPNRPPRPVEIDPDRLRQAYSGLRVLNFEAKDDIPDWSDEPLGVVRMSAVKD